MRKTALTKVIIPLFLFLLTLYALEPVPLCIEIPGKKPPVNYNITYEKMEVQELQEEAESTGFWFRTMGWSMYPTIKHNSICFCQAKENYSINDIVSFYVKENGKFGLISHRIVGFTYKNGSYYWITKGDYNVEADKWLLKNEQIICSIPYVRRYEVWLTYIYLLKEKNI